MHTLQKWNHGRRSVVGRGLSLVLVSVLLTGVSGCISVGPDTISRDRFNYGQAIADSWEEQMVFNMLRVRYGEAPVFLDVSQVINQYSLEGQLGAQGTVGGVPSSGTDALGASGAVRWADRPTITYTPLTGRRFTRNLLTPMDPAAVFSMIESGWPADLVFAIVVRSINGIRNDPSNTSQFEPLAAAIARLQESNTVDFSVVHAEDEARVQISFSKDLATDQTRADVKLIRTTLKLAEGIDEFVLKYGARPKESNALYLQTRTMLQILEELSYGIAVPPEHEQEGRTMRMPDSSGPIPKARQLLKVQSSLERPEDALVAVSSRGYWFAIDDRDFGSKRILAFLMIMLNLAESDEQNDGPAITIGTGA